MEIKAAVLCYNQPELTQAMIAQLGNVIIVDNGSTTPQSKSGHGEILILENRLFSGGWNAAMSVLTVYDWVWMLNSDLQNVSLEMMFALVAEAEYSGASLISPAFNSPHAHMQPQNKGVRQVSWIDWCCPLIKSSVWKEVGDFDYPRFKGYGADLDWCYRAKQKGIKFAVSDNHIVYHLGSQTALAEGLQGIQGNVAAMNEALKEKYGTVDWTEFTHKFLGEI